MLGHFGAEKSEAVPQVSLQTPRVVQTPQKTIKPLKTGLNKVKISFKTFVLERSFRFESDRQTGWLENVVTPNTYPSDTALSTNVEFDVRKN